jgi:hypothetical protein
MSIPERESLLSGETNMGKQLAEIAMTREPTTDWLEVVTAWCSVSAWTYHPRIIRSQEDQKGVFAPSLDVFSVSLAIPDVAMLPQPWQWESGKPQPFGPLSCYNFPTPTISFSVTPTTPSRHQSTPLPLHRLRRKEGPCSHGVDHQCCKSSRGAPYRDQHDNSPPAHKISSPATAPFVILYIY